MELHHCLVTDLRYSNVAPTIYTVRLARKHDLEALIEFFSKPDVVRERWNRGDACLIALANDEICAATWWMLGPNTYDTDRRLLGSVFSLPSGVCWSHDAKGTRFGAYGTLLLHQRHYLTSLGIKEVWGAVDYQNKNAIAANHAAGFTTAGWLLHLTYLGFRLTRCRTPNTGWCSLPAVIGSLSVHDGREVADPASRLRNTCNPTD
jgi:hypothetical protein